MLDTDRTIAPGDSHLVSPNFGRTQKGGEHGSPAKVFETTF
jgi:hypothetical protein